MTVQGAAHHRVRPRCLIEKDVLLKRAARNDEPPAAQARMGEAAARAKQRMPRQQQAGGFDGGDIAFGDVSAHIHRIPLELPFHVREEIVGLEQAHAAREFRRARTRWRRASKSA